MIVDLTSKAISAALNSSWQDAILANSELLKENPLDVEALNRLAHAYKQAGEIKKAQTTYRKVLKVDRFNPIATKNLWLLERLPKNLKNLNCNGGGTFSQMFLEEPGKTKVVALINLAPLRTILSLSYGNKVNLFIKRHTTIVCAPDGTYLGALPDDLSTKLMRLLRGGNRYEAFVKSVGKNCLSIFIRELFRSSRFKTSPTFPTLCSHSDHKNEEPENLNTRDNDEEPNEETGNEKDRYSF